MMSVEQLVAAGREAPAGFITDVAGQKACGSGDDTSILIVTFSGREGAKQLNAWMDRTTRELVAVHRDLPVNFLSFADLREVPSLLRRVVKPMLVAVHAKSKVDLASIYLGRKPKHHLVADWTGTYRDRYGLHGEALFHCLVIYRGRIVGAFHEPTDVGTIEFQALVSSLTEALNGPGVGSYEN